MTRPIRSLRDAIDELGKADARIEALEAAVHNLLSLLPPPAIVAMRFDTDKDLDDTPYDIISSALALLDEKTREAPLEAALDKYLEDK